MGPWVVFQYKHGELRVCKPKAPRQRCDTNAGLRRTDGVKLPGVTVRKSR